MCSYNFQILPFEILKMQIKKKLYLKKKLEKEKNLNLNIKWLAKEF